MPPSASARVQIVALDGHTLNPGDNPWDELRKLGELIVYDRSAIATIADRAREADILLTNKTPLDAALISSLPRLRFIAVTATGHNIVDSSAARQCGIPVSNVPDYGTDTVAQHTWALALELCHRCGAHSDLVHEGAWCGVPDFCFWKYPLIELTGQTLGIVGFGRIGRRVAAIAKAFGMRVQFYSRHAQPEQPDGTDDFVPLDQLLATSDVVSLHCALTPENKAMINLAALKRMKPTAFLINTSRGALINEADLAQALDTGIIAGAALDVLAEEPPRTMHPLFGRPNCILTPHMAWSSRAARGRLMKVTVANVQAFLAGHPANIVNGLPSV